MEHTFWEAFTLTFIPLFIVIDAIGTLPFILSAISELPRSQKRHTINMAILTAALVGLAFLFIGQAVLTIMGISVASFAIGGGIVLLALSINQIITGRMVEVIKEEMVAVVPIGTPLLAGPATITTLLLLTTQFPIYIILLSFILNMVLSWILFVIGDRIMRFMGQGGIKALSRIFGLLLAAIAVDMVLTGLEMTGIIMPAL